YQVAICGFQCIGSLDGNAFAVQLSEQANLFVTTDAVGASQAFASLGKKECSPAVIEMIRVEAGYPFSDFDVSADHLAQEFNRDATAISYEKGCYLGQETVARLDALGHTNRSFVQATIQQTVGDPEESPRIGDELFVDQKKVATISSMAFSPMHQCMLILATVRKPHHKPGSELLGNGYVAKVV
ncbi:tRNA-modifying protein YgfZ, partial [Pirellulaceae bacterium]|nr:tRNA-modifying protein YgfZ [Pirellulaceae bacterium]